jgi:PadR family transcriptional regulator
MQYMVAMESDAELAAWQTQLRKGAIELAILAVLGRGEGYGLTILERVNKGGALVSEGALYPLLTRLEKAGKLASRWDAGEGGNPRKYYRLTSEGEVLLGEMRQMWRSFRTIMDVLV